MNARDLIRRVRRIEIATRRAVEDTLAGRYHSVFRGRGMAFSEVRAYAPGDEVRSIDWNVSARMGHLFVKRFVEERELTVMLLCDLSGSSGFGSRERTKAEVTAEIAALLAFSAVANGDRVGLVLFTDAVERFVPPRKGRRHALRLVSEILQFRPRSRGTDVGAALQFLRRAMRRRTVSFLLSDLLDGADAGGSFRFERALRVALGRHDVVPIRILDRLEAEIPGAGLAWLEDPETGETARVDLSDRRVRAAYAAAARSEAERLRRLLARLEVDQVTVRADEPDHVRPLLAFFEARARRLA
jgi:uncharacterized protein (DUF58 family)